MGGTDFLVLIFVSGGCSDVVSPNVPACPLVKALHKLPRAIVPCIIVTAGQDREARPQNLREARNHGVTSAISANGATCQAFVAGSLEMPFWVQGRLAVGHQVRLRGGFLCLVSGASC